MDGERKKEQMSETVRTKARSGQRGMEQERGGDKERQGCENRKREYE